MILRQTKEKTKKNIMNNIEEIIKRNQLSKSNKKINNKNFMKIKNNKEIKSKEIQNNSNLNNNKFHIINNSKEKKKVIDENNNTDTQIYPRNSKEGEIIQNNKKYQYIVEKIKYKDDSNPNNIVLHNIKEKTNIKNNIQNKKSNINNTKNSTKRQSNNYPNNNKRNFENNKNNSSDKNILKYNGESNAGNNCFLNYFDDRIEQIREALNSINVIDTLSEQAGLQCYKNKYNNNDELYFEKAANLNKEYYDNLDIKLNQFEEFLNSL